jgi:hypothetical protein
VDSLVLTALLEAVGVLAGVLLAFSIDAAWDNRRDRGREKGYLSALAAEIGTNRERFARYRDLLDGQLRTNDHALGDIVFGGPTVEAGSVREWLRSTGALYLELPERAALSDILSSGGISFIEDPSVRRLISRYSDALDRQRTLQDNITMQWNARFVPYTTQHASLYDMVCGVPWNDGWIAPDLGSFEDDIHAFVGNREFANLIVHRSILIAMAKEATDGLLAVIDQISARVAKADDNSLLSS